MRQLQRVDGHPRGVQQLNRHLGNARRLLGRLGQHGIAGGQGRGNLTDKNRQREVPRTDAHPHPPRRERQGVGLAGHAKAVICQRWRHAMHLRHGQWLHDALRFVGVVTQKVDRLAHFADRITPGLVRLLDQQGAEHGCLLQHGVSGPAQDGGALGDRHFAPFLIAAHASNISASGVFDIKLWHHRNGRGGQRGQQRITHTGHGQVQPGAILARAGVGAEQVRRQRK